MGRAEQRRPHQVAERHPEHRAAAPAGARRRADGARPCRTPDRTSATRRSPTRSGLAPGRNPETRYRCAPRAGGTRPRHPAPPGRRSAPVHRTAGRARPSSRGGWSCPRRSGPRSPTPLQQGRAWVVGPRCRRDQRAGEGQHEGETAAAPMCGNGGAAPVIRVLQSGLRTWAECRARPGPNRYRRGRR